VDLSAIAVQGLKQSQDCFNIAASRLAAPGMLSGSNTADSADLSTAAVAVLSAKDDFAVKLKIINAADEMQRTTIDLLA
jgi:hypothetical protein